MGKCKSSERLETGAVSARLKPVENKEFEARCILRKNTLILGTFGIKSHRKSRKSHLNQLQPIE